MIYNLGDDIYIHVSCMLFVFSNRTVCVARFLFFRHAATTFPPRFEVIPGRLGILETERQRWKKKQSRAKQAMGDMGADVS